MDKEARKSWLEYCRKRLTETRHKRTLPQTKVNHKTLAEDEVRYARYIAQMEAQNEQRLEAA